MAGRSIVALIGVLLCASPLLAGQTDTAERFQVAKINPDDVAYQQTQPEVVCKLLVNEKHAYYDVKGLSAAQIRREMKLNGAKWNDGKVYAALTSWDIRYRYDVTSENGSYRIKSAYTDVDIVITMPRWEADKQAPAELAAEWARYSRVLARHEAGHKELAVEAAREINGILTGLGSFDSRAELDREARKQAQARLGQMKKMQVDYDEHTNHGIKQGAALADS